MYIKDEHCDGSFFYDSHSSHHEHVILLYDNNTASRMFGGLCSNLYCLQHIIMIAVQTLHISVQNDRLNQRHLDYSSPYWNKSITVAGMI